MPSPANSIFIGEWKASQYTIGVLRFDYHAVLRSDGSYEWFEKYPNKEARHAGTYSIDEGDKLLTLTPAEEVSDLMTTRWNILRITELEDARTVMVLRALKLASRNLPILFYRIHKPAAK